jgi:hypothetical protein
MNNERSGWMKNESQIWDGNRMDEERSGDSEKCSEDHTT